MGRLLLSTGQVSVLVSAFIVFSFTFALFLSGYILQQRYVHNLQAAIKPRLPKPLEQSKSIDQPRLDAKWARPMGSRPELDEAYEQLIAAQKVDWSRLGYVQVVRRHVELCSAVMLLSDLHKMRSPAKRLLMFPKLWLMTSHDDVSSEMSTTRRLLRNAARRYGVTLIPIEPISEDLDDTIPASYSLASLYSLTDYERVMYLEGPGVLLDASALDSLLAFSKSEPMAAFPATPERKALSTSLLMVHPWRTTFSRLKELRKSETSTDVDLFQQAFAAPESLLPEWSLSMGNVIYESQQLRRAGDDFNATAFEQTTTFVKLSDARLPGPEYDIPFAERVQMRPQNREAEETWSSLYERFRQSRMEVCGLDLEVYQPSELGGSTGAAQAGDGEL